MVTIRIKDSAFAAGGRFYGIPRHKVFLVIPINRPSPSYVGVHINHEYYTDRIYGGALNLIITDNPVEIPDERFWSIGPGDDANVSNIRAVLSHFIRMDIVEVRKDDVVLTPLQVTFFFVPGYYPPP